MVDQSARNQNWLADLAAINAEIDAIPPRLPKPTRKRVRKPKPLWEE